MSEILKQTDSSMKDSQNDLRINKIALALSKAQSEFEPIVKNKTVSVKTKQGGSYTFDYADFDAVINAVKKPLTKNELSYCFITNGDCLSLILMHSSGQKIESSAAIVRSGDIKEFGSQLTYLKRYLLSAMLGVATEDDDDGSRANGDESSYVKNDLPWYNTFDKDKDRLAGIVTDKGSKYVIGMLGQKYKLSNKTKDQINELS